MRNKLYKYIYYLFFVLLTLSCTTDDLVKVDNSSVSNKYRCFIRVSASSAITQTRSASDLDIDFSQLHVLVYDENNNYLTNADIDVTKYPPKYDEKLEAYELVFSLPITEDLATLVFIANVKDFDDIKSGSYLTDLYDNQRLNLSGKWEDGKSNLVPMWGEINDVMLTGEYSDDQMKVSLLRSMAKIDIQTELFPEVFTISSAHIYLSLADGLIIPQKENLDKANNRVTAPSLIPNTLFNVGTGDPTSSQTDAKQSPLSYVLSSDELTEPIYIPEQAMGSDGALDCFIVVGGFFRGQTTESFYKISFGTDVTNKGFNILRNYRYILNIKQVNGLGYPTAQDAMEAPSTNIVVDVVDWDENVNDGYVFGDKHFGIHDEPIFFSEPTAGQTQTISFQTNLSDEVLESQLDYRLSNVEENNFDLTLDVQNKQFKITTFDNNTHQLKSDALIINMYGRIINIPIGQSPGNFKYYIDCESASVHGVYIPQKPLNSDNYVEVMVNSDEDLSGSYYRILSSELDGMSFFGDGNFDMVENSAGYFSQKLRLLGRGTPKTSLTKYLNLSMNTTEPQTCSFEVQMIYSTKKIIAQSLNITTGGDVGYVMNAQYSELFRKSTYNFGAEPYSTVKVEGLDYSFLGVTVSSYTKEDNDALNLKLKDADILVSGRSIGDKSSYPTYTDALKNLMSQRAKIVGDFLKNKGVAIIIEADLVYLKYLFKELYDDSMDISFYQPGNKIGYSYKLVDIPGDHILNGPFGDMNGKSWGTDATIRSSSGDLISTLVGLPDEDIIVYSNGLSADTSAGATAIKPLKGAQIFKHLKYNLFLIVDDGFLVGNQPSATPTFYVYTNPFTVVTNPPTYVPALREKYGVGGSATAQSVYNSAIFGNIMNWALEAAEFKGKHSDPY